MNTRFKMALLLHSGESGFAMVIAVSLGLIMILVGLTMTMRSQGDQIVASTQKASERSLGAAEKGVGYYQAFLNSNRYLNWYPDCVSRNSSGVCTDSGSTKSWWNATSIAPISTCVGNSAPLTTIQSQYSTTAWQPVDSNDATKGEFRLVSYKINSSDPSVRATGILTVEGRITNPNASSAANKSINRLQVSIPITIPDINSIPIPGVWVSNPTDTNSTGGNTIRGNVIVNSCSATLANIKIDPTTPQFSAQYTNLPIPSVPTMPAALNTSTTPPTPGTIPLGTINTDLTLPRPGDVAISSSIYPDARYIYSATDIVKSGGSTTLTITPGQKVTIFLSGDIDKNVEIAHECGSVSGCLPTNFQIFGTKPSGGQICLNGNRVVDAFILAPKYQAGVAGGGSGGGINGSIWVDTWSNGGSCGSNSNNVVVRQTANWSELAGLIDNSVIPSPIGPLKAWKRNVIN